MRLFMLRCWMCNVANCDRQRKGLAVCEQFSPCMGLGRHLRRHPGLVSARERVIYMNLNKKEVFEHDI